MGAFFVILACSYSNIFCDVLQSQMKKIVQEQVRDLDTDVTLTGYLKNQNIAQENFCAEVLLQQCSRRVAVVMTLHIDSDSNIKLDSLADVFMESYSRMLLLII